MDFKEDNPFTPVNPPAKQVLDRLTEGLTQVGAKKVIDNAASRAIMAVHVECERVTDTGTFYTVAHYYEQSGVSMADPLMNFLRTKDGNYYPLSYEQSGLGLKQEVVVLEHGQIKGFRPNLQQQLVEFCDMWMDNIQAQQFGGAESEREPEAPGESGLVVIQAKFPLGRIGATPGAMEALERAGQLPTAFLDRHAQGDWGELEPEDVAENELSLEKGFRLFSVYHTTDGTKLYVITEADRSVTTLLLPDEY